MVFESFTRGNMTVAPGIELSETNPVLLECASSWFIAFELYIASLLVTQ